MAGALATFDEKRFQEPPAFTSILEDAPRVSAVPTAFMRESFERGKEEAFDRYVRQEPLKIVAWLDSLEALQGLETALERRS